VAAVAGVVAVVLGSLTGTGAASAVTGQAIISSAECTQHTLSANDDGSTSAIPLPFSISFYQSSYSSLWVNNNGNVTFDGPLSTFTPFGLSNTMTPIIAPVFADVHTRGQ